MSIGKGKHCKKMHIILITSGRIFGTSHGGEDRFTNAFGNWLAKQYHNVTLIGIDFAGMRIRQLPSTGGINKTNREQRNEAQAQPNQLRFGLVLALRYVSYSLRAFLWIFQVLRILIISLRSPISLINAQDSGYTGLAAIIAAKLLGLRVIISLHGIRYSEIESNPFLNRLIKKLVLKLEKKIDRFTLKNADLITVVSPTISSYVKQMAPEKIAKVLPVAINSKKFQYSKINRDLVRSQMGIDNQATVVGYVGRLSYEKNLFTLLESFADASRDNPSLVLMLVGKGTLESELRKIVNRLNIQGKVNFCGVREDIGAILSTFDIFILPSFIEALSNSLLEAMTSGRAIICSDIEGNRQLITDNIEGILVNPKNPESISSSIRLLSKDSSLRGRLGQNAKIKANQYDEDVIFPKILNEYFALITH
jgi:glycosyltransferase involved in cell wall biosynthesis